jgi:hypothetical protein
VVTIPTSPRASAAINSDMPTTIPARAEKPICRIAGRGGSMAGRSAGIARRRMKKAAPVPDLTAIAATGSAPASMAGRASRLPVA